MVSNDMQYSYCYRFLTMWVSQGETARLRSELDARYRMPPNCNI